MMPRPGRVLLCVVMVIGMMQPTSQALCQWFDRNPERWRFGADVGLWDATIDYTVRPAFAANVDYFIDRVFSVGPMVLASSGSNLAEVALAGVVRYHYRTPLVNIVPFTGLGLIYGDPKNRGSDASHYVPLGLTFEYQATKQLAFSITGLLNLHFLSYTGGITDEKSATLLFGVRYGGPTPRSIRSPAH